VPTRTATGKDQILTDHDGDPGIAWGEANAANDDGEAVMRAEREAGEADAAAPKYERLAVDGDGDTWGRQGGQWKCLTSGGAADDDAELERQFPPVTFYLPPVPLGRGQLGTALAALEDAAAYRREYQDGDCTDCDALPKGVLCGDHACDEAVASMYDLLHDELQEHQGTVPAGKPQEDAATAAWEERA
jgi:hypothetical protein